ncbi:MAG: FimV/HubP family polar landmark protein [Burkholderiales bacterium]
MGKSITMRIFAAALLAVPLLAHAVGLGNLRVLSALGQPLDAEIQIVSEQPGEMSSVTARLASQDAFRQAGVDFNPVLLGMKFDVQTRNGKSVLKLSTTQPVNEPFLDMLVELQWSSGRLVREYTFLLDPPEYKATQAINPAPSAVPVEKPAQAPAAAAPVQERPLEAAPAPAPAPAVTPAPTPAPKATAVPEAKPATREVNKGDTLGAIARENLTRGITYNQMLIALYRANRGAFIHDNINLVRAGRILDIPDHDTVAAIDPEDARRLVQSQMVDFGAYRRKLAAAAPATSAAAGERAVSGRIGATPEPAAPAAQKDQLKLSKADTGSGPMSRAAREDDQAARERALQEAQSRVAELERNVSDLQKLVELKNKALAELQQKAAAPAPVPATAAAIPATPTAAPKPVPTKTAQTPKPMAVPAKPALAPAPKPAPRPARKPNASPPPTPSPLDDLRDNAMAVGGLGVALVLLLGYGAWVWRRKKKAAAGLQQGSFDAAAGAGGDASVLSAARAPSVRADAGSQASVSQASVGGMEADEVDPIAEADVYMAYGRDAQAEEILKEALQKDAKRPAIHAKLLEIYAGRHDTTSFEQAARRLQALIGSGPEWEKAAALGRGIDPQNSLYGGTADARVIRTAPALEAAGEPAPVPNLDFDLDAASTPISPDIPLDGSDDAGEQPASAALDFDIGASTNTMKVSDFAKGGTLIMDKNAEPKTEPTGLDFDLGLGGAKPRKTADSGGISFEFPAKPQPSATDTFGSMDFNLDLDSAETKPMPAPAAEPAPLDLSSISLDLDTPGDNSAPSTSTDPKWQEVATKLDLAKAYEEMGDKDGARELLNEVVKEGDGAQQSQAKQMLSSLG